MALTKLHSRFGLFTTFPFAFIQFFLSRRPPPLDRRSAPTFSQPAPLSPEKEKRKTLPSPPLSFLAALFPPHPHSLWSPVLDRSLSREAATTAQYTHCSKSCSDSGQKEDRKSFSANLVAVKYRYPSWPNG